MINITTHSELLSALNTGVMVNIVQTSVNFSFYEKIKNDISARAFYKCCLDKDSDGSVESIQQRLDAFCSSLTDNSLVVVCATKLAQSCPVGLLDKIVRIVYEYTKRFSHCAVLFKLTGRYHALPLFSYCNEVSLKIRFDLHIRTVMSIVDMNINGLLIFNCKSASLINAEALILLGAKSGDEVSIAIENKEDEKNMYAMLASMDNTGRYDKY